MFAETKVDENQIRVRGPISKEKVLKFQISGESSAEAEGEGGGRGEGEHL
jgi:hypothetical protein